MAMSMEKARSARFMQGVAYWVMDEMRDCGEFTCFGANGYEVHTNNLIAGESPAPEIQS
jgi:hypothetical protein